MRTHLLALLLTVAATGTGFAVAEPTSDDLHIAQTRSSAAAGRR
jgi:hypothetical protein